RPESTVLRDPAAGLTGAQRSAYDALPGRGAGEEEAAVLAGAAELGALFEAVVAEGNASRDAAALLVHDLRPALGGRSLEASKATPDALARVLAMVDEKTLTRNAASEVVSVLVNDGGSAEAVVEERGLRAVRDDATLAPLVE